VYTENYTVVHCIKSAGSRPILCLKIRDMLRTVDALFSRSGARTRHPALSEGYKLALQIRS
jgi:hypothetical protein